MKDETGLAALCINVCVQVCTSVCTSVCSCTCVYLRISRGTFCSTEAFATFKFEPCKSSKADCGGRTTGGPQSCRQA